MKHLTPVNRKAARVESVTAREATETSSLCSRAARRSSPSRRTFPTAARWSSRPAGKPIATAAPPGLCQPVERDLFDCHMGCFWPAQVPDQLNHAPDWTAKCAAAQKDWRKIDLIFPADEKKK